MKTSFQISWKFFRPLTFKAIYETRYSRMDQVKFVKESFKYLKEYGQLADFFKGCQIF